MTIETSRTILVIDDDIQVRDTVTLFLSRRGCVVQSAMNIDTAYRIINGDSPDVVLVDLELPCMDLQALNTAILARNSNAKLLVMTAIRQPGSRTRTGLKVLVKPIEEAALLMAIGSCDMTL